MADLIAPTGSWLKPPDDGPPRVEFHLAANGRRVAFRPKEILFLVPDDSENVVNTLFQQLWDALELADDVAEAREKFGDDTERCDVAVGEELGEPITLASDEELLETAKVIKIRFTEDNLDRSPFVDASTVEILEALEGAGLDTTPSLNHVYFSASSGVMWGSPVMWSSVGGAPVTWSAVDGTPVTWSGVGGAPVTWSGLFGAPVTWSGVGGAPVTWSGLTGTPVTWSGVGGTPVTWSSSGWRGGTATGSCCCDDEEHREFKEPDPEDTILTSARVALDPGYAKRRNGPPVDISAVMDGSVDKDDLLVEGTCRVVILDTGLHSARVDGAAGIPGLDNADPEDADGDKLIDPASGHGLFIAGIVRRLAPEATIEVGRVLSSFGDGSDCVIATVIRHLARSDVPGILNLSFVGYSTDDDPPPVLADAIATIRAAGWVVVAAAGNDATCRKAWPAAIDDVVAVGAIAPWGPAWFTNHGSWVNACAPGFDILSDWLDLGVGDANTPKRAADAPDAHPRGWAAWSGTSFSAPIVAAALARDVISAGWPPNNVDALLGQRQNIVDAIPDPPTDADIAQAMKALTNPQLVAQPLPGDPNADPVPVQHRLAWRKEQLKQAVERVIDDPRLARVPCLGTIVNDHL